MKRQILTALAVLAIVIGSTGPAPAQTAQELLEALEAFEGSELLLDPEHVMAWVTAPRAVAVGDEVVVVVEIENARGAEALRLSSIDLGDPYLDGFDVAKLDPAPRNRDHSLGTLTLEYPVDIPAGKTWKLTIRLRAKKPGVYVGDIDIWEGERFLTRVAQTRVR